MGGGMRTMVEKHDNLEHWIPVLYTQVKLT